jgi:hypothetical protein
MKKKDFLWNVVTDGKTWITYYLRHDPEDQRSTSVAEQNYLHICSSAMGHEECALSRAFPTGNYRGSCETPRLSIKSFSRQN